MAQSARILVVEDGPGEREALDRVLRLEGFDVLATANPQEALEHIHEPIDLILSDLRMGKSSGLDLLRYWKSQRPHTPFIMITAYGDVESAVLAMKLGARDYLTKPIYPDQLLELIRHVLKEHPEAAPACFQAPVPVSGADGMERMVGQSAAMLDVFDQTRRAAQAESTVLILGESGTGKELIAEAIHENGPRQEGPFVVVNMAAIPESLAESELFGHVRGAFTGATSPRMGRFESANDGTIFIDEIGDFPLTSQAKLLRALENHTVTPVGSNDNRTVNVRVVAATSRNLQQMVARGAFREDLYYRLNVVAICLPPLRDRVDDIPLLADFFLHQFCEANRVAPLQIAPELMQRMQAFAWPGNVRQLRNAMECMVVMARGPVLTVEDLPRNISQDFEPGTVAEGPTTDARSLDEVQRSATLRTLEQHGGNRTRTAEALGISLRTLQRHLRQWSGRDDAVREP